MDNEYRPEVNDLLPLGEREARYRRWLDLRAAARTEGSTHQDWLEAYRHAPSDDHRVLLAVDGWEMFAFPEGPGRTRPGKIVANATWAEKGMLTWLAEETNMTEAEVVRTLLYSEVQRQAGNKVDPLHRPRHIQPGYGRQFGNEDIPPDTATLGSGNKVKKVTRSPVRSG